MQKNQNNMAEGSAFEQMESPQKRKETSGEVQQKLITLCSDAEIDIPDMAYDRFHRFGKAYIDKGTNKI